MDLKALPLGSSLADYERQASVVGGAGTRAEVRRSVAAFYGFRDWEGLVAHVEAMARQGPVLAFETAVEAVVDGDREGLGTLLRNDPTLIVARSHREHRATLLHYIAANGVEGYRQRSPGNAVEMARVLLEAGAEVDARADMYGSKCTTLSLLVSSTPPDAAGVQAGLVEVLLDFGAAIEGKGSGRWSGPLYGALAFGHLEAARTLARRGARIGLAEAAGLGMDAEAAELLPAADTEARHRALALAAQQGWVEMVRMLLDVGEDANRYNPRGNHAHSTPLHQAVLGGHDAVVRLLLERGARADIRDTVWQGTALGWAMHGGGKKQVEMAELLRGYGARE